MFEVNKLSQKPGVGEKRRDVGVAKKRVHVKEKERKKREKDRDEEKGGGMARRRESFT